MRNLQPSSAFNATDASLGPDDIGEVSDVLALTTTSVSHTLAPLIIETVLFGIFTLLILLSTYLIWRKGLHTAIHKAMLFATLTMYATAAMSWASQLRVLFAVTKEMVDVQGVVSDCLGELQNQGSCSRRVYPTFQKYLETTEGPMNVCVPTTLLTIALSDAIVLWRAWVIRSRGRLVQCISIVLLLATTALSILDTRDACAPLNLRQLYEGNIFGAAAFILSWTTNVWATSLIAVKAWKHRKFIASHLEDRSAHTRTEKAMALFIESGVLYCLLWTFLVVFELVNTFGAPASSNFDTIENRFDNASAYLVKSGLVQLVGIYPTVVIVAVCLEKMHWEQFFVDDTSRLVPIAPEVRLREITVTVDLRTSEGSATSPASFTTVTTSSTNFDSQEREPSSVVSDDCGGQCEKKAVEDEE